MMLEIISFEPKIFTLTDKRGIPVLANGEEVIDSFGNPVFSEENYTHEEIINKAAITDFEDVVIDGRIQHRVKIQLYYANGKAIYVKVVDTQKETFKEIIFDVFGTIV